MTPRKLAYDLLLRSEKSKQYSNIVLDNALSSTDLKEADKRLTATLFYGVTERRITLDYIISRLASRELAKIDIGVLTALRMGIYQLRFLDRIPAHAAINETVSLVNKKSSGFVNAVLRSYTRANGIELPDKNDLPLYLSVRYSVCPALAERFIRDMGAELAESTLEGFDKIPDITIRVNTQKTSREELLSHMDDAYPTDSSPCGIHAKGSVRELFGFDEGLFFVQDEASQICVEALDANEGQLMLDICACPGSKSFGAALNMKNHGKVLSFDLHENKLSLIRSGAERLGISIIETKAHDGRSFIEELEGRADRILCDVPCSGFGVLAKKPELRTKDPAESGSLPDIQRAILENACKYLKRGGILVYSTCTLLPAENENNIKGFLSDHPEFSLAPWSFGRIDAPLGMLTLYPHIHGTDGFFIAKLIKN